MNGCKVTHLDARGCPTTEPSTVLSIRHALRREDAKAYVLEPDGTTLLIPVSHLAPWIEPPAGYVPPPAKEHVPLFAGRFGFLRGCHG